MKTSEMENKNKESNLKTSKNKDKQCLPKDVPLLLLLTPNQALSMASNIKQGHPLSLPTPLTRTPNISVPARKEPRKELFPWTPSCCSKPRTILTRSMSRRRDEMARLSATA